MLAAERTYTISSITSGLFVETSAFKRMLRGLCAAVTWSSTLQLSRMWTALLLRLGRSFTPTYGGLTFFWKRQDVTRLNVSYKYERDALDPSSPYAASKAGADVLALSYFKTYGLPILITRSSNNFGPYQYPEKLIPLFTLNALEGKPLPVYGDGRNVRDWIYVQDNCAAIDLVAQKGASGEIYNIATQNERENLEVVHLILKSLRRSKELIQFVQDRPGHDRRYSLDTVKVEELGWYSSTQFEDALRETVHWYQKNEWWWKPLREARQEAK